jgi:integrase
MSKIVRKNDQSNPLRKVGECLYRNGHGVYFAWFSIRGKQLKRSLKTSDKELARRRLAELRKVAARLHGLEDRNLRFEEVVRAWLESIKGGLKPSSYRRRVVCINQLMPFFKTIPMRSITSADIEKWKLRRGATIAARTFNKELETLNHVIRYARDVKGILLDNPAEKVGNRKTATATVAIPSKEQFRELLGELRNEPQAVRSGAAAFTEFLAYSGLRLGEGREVRWRDVNFELNTVLVTGGETGTKNHQHRTIPLFPGLRRLLESMRTASCALCEAVFASWDRLADRRASQNVNPRPMRPSGKPTRLTMMDHLLAKSHPLVVIEIGEGVRVALMAARKVFKGGKA